MDDLKLSLQIADLITLAENREIEFDVFHARLTYLESLRGKENGKSITKCNF